MILEDLVFSNKVGFLAKVRVISARLDIKPDYLMAVMAFESGISSTAKNKSTKAVGLIQFMPKTAIALGTTTDALEQMTNVQQLEYVHKYLKPYTGRMKSLIDVYFAVFFPAAIDKDKNWVMQAGSLSASKIAQQNPIFDNNRDQKITVAEVETTMNDWLKKKIS